MKYLVAFILIVIGLCEANQLVCQIFNQSEKSLEQYCNENAIIPVNCTKELNSIDSSQVEKLKLRGCEPNFVVNTTKELSNLRVLDISYSGYKSLDWLNLKFNQLQIFNASHNELHNCSYSFKNTPEVVEIDLSHNSLLRNTLPQFKGLDKLKKLHLSNNDIFYSVDGSYFDSKNLEFIDLESNGLVSILKPEMKDSLKALHLENNPISFYSCNLIGHESYPSLTSLHFSWKSVDGFYGDTSDCDGKRIRIVKNTTFEGIFITKDRKYEMHCPDKCLASVYTFRAGYKTFENVSELIEIFGSNIHSLDLSKNYIGELNTYLFDQFFVLDELNLSETSLTKFDFDLLRNNQRLSSIDISNNKLKQLNNVELLQDHYKLEVLNLGGNQIEHVNEIIEHLNPYVKELDVSENDVGNLTATTLHKLVYLQRLNMKNTNLTLPNLNPFETLQSLMILDLSQNNLGNVNFSAWSIILNNLSELALSDCRIKNISEVIQYLGSSLQKLDLSKNVAQGLSEHTFQTLNQLRVLNLSDTNLLNINANPFKYLRNLDVLDLSHNKLKVFDLKLLPIRIYRLNLEGNDLTELKNLRGSDFKGFSLKLANNRFHCSYMKELSKSKDINLLGESWLQKDERDCRSSAQSVNDFLNGVYESVKFW